VKCHFKQLSSTVQCFRILLCLLLVLEGSSQILAIPHTDNAVTECFISYHIKNQQVRGHATWYDYQIYVWFRNWDFSLFLFSDPWKHLKAAFLFSLEEHLSSVPDLSLLFDHEPFCHLTFLITFKCDYTRNFFFPLRTSFLFKITYGVNFFPSART
jgi:hypothetical protein